MLNFAASRVASGAAVLRKGSVSAGEVQLVGLVCLVLCLIAIYARGTWLDEYWSVWLSGPSLPFTAAARNRWLPDVGHPALFNTLFWAIGQLGDTTIVLRRFADLAFAV